MNNLHVDGEFAAVVRDDEDTNGAAAGLEGVTEARPEAGLIDDAEVGLDVALYVVPLY
jgi:hypothetical protein